MIRRGLIPALALSVAIAACASRGPKTFDNDPAAIAALNASVRLIGGDTTWFVRGPSYELVARTRPELVAVKPSLDRAEAALQRVFPADTLAQLLLTVRRTTPPNHPFIAPPALPTNEPGRVVEIVLPDPKAKADQDKARREGAVDPFGLRDPALPAVRAWLSGHATAMTHEHAKPTEASGEVEDPRVPAWAESLIPSLAGDSLVDRLSLTLALHSQDLIPLSRYFAMSRPDVVVPAVASRNVGSSDGGGENRGGGGMGGRGGMSGRGGMGAGGGGMGGRRGSGGSRSGGSEGQREAPGPQGAALFDLQSLVFGEYLARNGYPVIGALTDAGIAKTPIDSALAAHSLGTADQLDAEWRHWLMDRAAQVTQR